MFRHWMRETVRGVTLVACVLVLALSAGEVAQSSGFGACMAALRDDVLSLLGVADGDPARTRVNESGALWTVDSDLADAIHGGNILAPAGGETSFLLPCGTRWFKLRMYPGASATDALLVGGDSGVNALPVMLSTPLDVYDLDVPVFGTTIWVAPSGGSVNGRYLYGVSQNPD